MKKFRFLLMCLCLCCLACAPRGEIVRNAGGAQRSTEEALQDSRITAIIRSRMRSSAEFSNLNPGIRTYQGAVEFSDYTGSEEQFSRLRTLALSVRGVREVFLKQQTE